MTDEYYAQKTRELEGSTRLDNPINLEEWFPERPYFNDPEFGHALVAYYNTRAERWNNLAPMMPCWSRWQRSLVTWPITSACTTSSWAFWRPTNSSPRLLRGHSPRPSPGTLPAKCIIWGKHVTGHAVEYHYHDGTGFIKINDTFGPPFYRWNSTARCGRSRR